MSKRLLGAALLSAFVSLAGIDSASAQSIRCVYGLSSQGPDNFLVIRHAPSLDSGWRQDARLYNGDCVQIIGEARDFYHIRYRGVMGWSAKIYLRSR